MRWSELNYNCASLGMAFAKEREKCKIATVWCYKSLGNRFGKNLCIQLLKKLTPNEKIENHKVFHFISSTK